MKVKKMVSIGINSSYVCRAGAQPVMADDGCSLTVSGLEV